MRPFIVHISCEWDKGGKRGEEGAGLPLPLKYLIFSEACISYIILFKCQFKKFNKHLKHGNKCNAAGNIKNQKEREKISKLAL